MERDRVLLGLFGAGGFGREVMPFARECSEDVEAVFVENDPDSDELNGHSVYDEEAFWQAEARQKLFNVAVGDPSLRKRIAEDAFARGARPYQLKAPTATMLDVHSIAEGGVFCYNSIVGSNVRIGRFFQLNMNAYLAHDCVVGDYVTLSPAVCCCGRVTIGDLVFVGAGAIIRDGTSSKPLTIGEGAVIGMGAVVTDDVPPYTTMVGNPAKPLAKE